MAGLMSSYGTQSFLKEGSKHLSGIDEAVLKNIEACHQMAEVTRTSMGPNGMNKMVVNHLNKLFVTSDANTIVKELEVQHPAAKLLVLGSSMQQQEYGDGTNFCIVFGGELLYLAEELLRMGLHPSEVVAGYSKAGTKALEILNEYKHHKVSNVRDHAACNAAIKAAIASKQMGLEDFLTPLVVDACIQVLPKNAKNLNVDNVRTVKAMGGSIYNSTLINGFALVRDTEGVIKHSTNCTVAVFSCGIDSAEMETKGTVLMKNADDLMNYTKSEEAAMEKTIKAIVDSGANVVVAGGTIGELALHFLERYKIMVVKTPSKFELRRIARSINATPLVRLGAPTPEEMGHSDIVTVEEHGETKVTVFRQEKEDSAISTILLRGGTNNMLDDLERAIDDGVNVFKSMIKDNRFCPGAGATEIEIAAQLFALAEASPGLEQYAIKKFAESLECVPRTLAENCGQNPTDCISNLYAAHAKGNANAGLCVETGGVIDAFEHNIYDQVSCKYNAVKLAVDAAITVLRVDQIIMSRPAGQGGNTRANQPMDAGDAMM